MKLSARNVLPGRVVAIEKGPTTSLVKIEVAPSLVLTATITTEAVEELALAVGVSANAVVKSSDVLVAVEK
jgi:molybdopterin-binding protein